MTRNRLDHVVAAGAIGHANGADAAGRPRVTIGGKAHAWFVRKRDDIERPRPIEPENSLMTRSPGLPKRWDTAIFLR